MNMICLHITVKNFIFTEIEIHKLSLVHSFPYLSAKEVVKQVLHEDY